MNKNCMLISLLFAFALAACQRFPAESEMRLLPLQSLLVLPSVYEGSNISVAGCLELSKESVRLFANCEVMQRAVYPQSVILGLGGGGKILGNRKIWDMASQSCSGLYISVEGNFQRLSGAPRDGVIRNIQSLTVWEHPEYEEEASRRNRIAACTKLLKELPSDLAW